MLRPISLSKAGVKIINVFKIILTQYTIESKLLKYNKDYRLYNYLIHLPFPTENIDSPLSFSHPYSIRIESEYEANSEREILYINYIFNTVINKTT